MIINKYEDREQWLAGRRGKITGSRLKDIISKRATTGYKKGYYELIAEKIAIEPDGERPMDRGNRLELEAIERFTKETKKKVNTDLVIWTMDDNKSIAISPDGYIEKGKKIVEAVEAKCLSSASHIEAWITKQIPDEYQYQKLQYFIVNPDLETLHFVFYDPRIPCKDYFTIETHRKDIEKEILETLEYESKILESVNAEVCLLTF